MADIQVSDNFKIVSCKCHYNQRFPFPRGLKGDVTSWHRELGVCYRMQLPVCKQHVSRPFTLPDSLLY